MALAEIERPRIFESEGRERPAMEFGHDHGLLMHSNSLADQYGLVDKEGRKLTAGDILRKTGIESRRNVWGHQTPLSMGVIAAQGLVRRDEEFDSVIFTTSFPVPGFNHADGLVEQLGIKANYTQEVAIACSGFARALANIYRNPRLYGDNVLIDSSEAYSPYTVKLNGGVTDADQSIAEFIFGDGAVATRLNMNLIELLSAADAFHEESDDIALPVNYSNPVGNTDYIEIPRSRNGKFMQHGPRVIEFIRKKTGPKVYEAMERANLRPENIKFVLAHQPTMPGLRNFSLSAPDFVVPVYYQNGNLSSASIPALMMAMKEGRVHTGFKNGKLIEGDFRLSPGDTSIIVGYGAGVHIEAVTATFH